MGAVSKFPILITGGGIGGLTAALALHRAGVGAQVVMRENDLCEQSPGAVVIWGNAVRILDRLGLGSRFRTLAMPITSGEICSSIDMRKLHDFHSENEGAAGDWWVASRTELRQCIFEALPPHSVSFGTKLISYETNPFTNKVTAGLLSRTWHGCGEHDYGQEFLVTVDLLVGADGSRSFVRSEMTDIPSSASSYSSSYTRWQCIVENRDTETFPFHFSREIWGSGRRFGTLRMSPIEVFWWAVANDDIFLRPFKPKLRRKFQHFPHKTAELIESSGQIARYCEPDFPLDFPWVHKGGVALLGDAAHPGPPGFPDGCCLAIEDAYALSQSVTQYGLTSDALWEYQCARRPRAVRSVLHGRAIWKIAQWEHPFARKAREKILGYTGISQNTFLLCLLTRQPLSKLSGASKPL